MYHMCCHGDAEKLELLMLVVEQVEVVDQQMAVSERDIIKEICTYRKDTTMYKLYMYLIQ